LAANTPLVKASFNLPADELDELRREAEARHVTVTQVLREALADRRFLNDQQRKNKKILLKSPDGDVAEVVFRPGAG
jgi:hypothetical protein